MKRFRWYLLEGGAVTIRCVRGRYKYWNGTTKPVRVCTTKKPNIAEANAFLDKTGFLIEEESNGLRWKKLSNSRRMTQLLEQPDGCVST